MKFILFPIGLFFIPLFGLTGQNSSKSFHLGISLVPQVSSLLNGDKKGVSKSGLGFEVKPSLIKKVNNKLSVETGIHLQKVNLKQRYHELQWPADVIDGHWDPSRSHEQYEAKYFALGLAAGLNLKMNEKENTWKLSCSAIMRRVIHFEDKLIINESGHFTDFDEAGLNNEIYKTQFFLSTGLNYDFELNHKTRFSMGPSFEYSLRDLLKTSSPNLLWSYGGGHPFFLGFRFAYNVKS